MNWKFVFNTNLKIYKDQNEAAKTASNAGYRFFIFNGNVYFITDDFKINDTGINIKDMQ